MTRQRQHPRAPATHRCLAGALITATLLVGPAASQAQGVPPGFVIENAFPGVVFDEPTQIVFLPDGRKLVAQKPGLIRVIMSDGTVLPDAYLNIRLEVLDRYDRGLLSIAIDPDFETTPWLYVLFTVDPDGDGDDDELDTFCRLTRYLPRDTNPNQADPLTREVLMGATWPEGPPTLHTSHTVGTLRFARDRTLLVSVGDGAHFETPDFGGLDPDGFLPGRTDPAEDMGAFRSRSAESLAGKILRLDKDTGHGVPSNPHWDGDPTSDRSKVWLYGLRNPFRFSIRPGTGSTDPGVGDAGALYIGDVGWNTYEELNIAESGGGNGGWPCFEGPGPVAAYQNAPGTASGNTNVLCPTPINPENPAPPTPPALWWHHTLPGSSNPSGWMGRSITGGVFYTGTEYPIEYQGSYFVADFVGDWILQVMVDSGNTVTDVNEFVTDARGMIDMEVDPETGDLFYISWFDEEVRRIRYIGGVPVEPDPTPPPPTLAVSTRPNPFRSATSIAIDLPVAGPLSITIHDAAGRRVRSLEPGHVPAGTRILTWDGRDNDGRELGAGAYFVRIRAGEATRSIKVTRTSA